VFGSKGSELVARDDCDAPRREGKRPRTAWLLCRVHSGKERFLEVKIAAEEALLAKLVDLPHQDSGSLSGRFYDIYRCLCDRTALGTSGSDWTILQQNL
jgi:hypothetical protein